METVTITKQEYNELIKKAEFADDVLIQLESSLKDIKEQKIKRVA